MTKETQAWIKEFSCYFKNKQKKHENSAVLGDAEADFDIKRVIYLNGDPTIERMEALISHMKQYSKVKE